MPGQPPRGIGPKRPHGRTLEGLQIVPVGEIDRPPRPVRPPPFKNLDHRQRLPFIVGDGKNLRTDRRLGKKIEIQLVPERVIPDPDSDGMRGFCDLHLVVGDRRVLRRTLPAPDPVHPDEARENLRVIVARGRAVVQDERFPARDVGGKGRLVRRTQRLVTLAGRIKKPHQHQKIRVRKVVKDLLVRMKRTGVFLPKPCRDLPGLVFDGVKGWPSNMKADFAEIGCGWHGRKPIARIRPKEGSFVVKYHLPW